MEEENQNKNKSEKAPKKKEQKKPQKEQAQKSQENQKTDKELAFDNLIKTGITKGIEEEDLYKSLSEDEMNILTKNVSELIKSSKGSKPQQDSSERTDKVESRIEKRLRDQSSKEIEKIKSDHIPLRKHKEELALQAVNVSKLRKQIADLKKQSSEKKSQS